MTSGNRFKVREQVPGFSSSSYIEGPGSYVPLKMTSKWRGSMEFPTLRTIMTKRSGGKANAVSDSALNVAPIVCCISSLTWQFLPLHGSAAEAFGSRHSPRGERKKRMNTSRAPILDQALAWEYY